MNRRDFLKLFATAACVGVIPKKVLDLKAETTLQERILATNPVAYWPLYEGKANGFWDGANDHIDWKVYHYENAACLSDGFHIAHGVVWDRVLSAEEIKRIYNQQLADMK